MSTRTNSVKLFVNELVEVLNTVGNANLKAAIGDSTNNNRVPTVNQVIRYLTTRRSTAYRTLGRQLQALYTKNTTTNNIRSYFSSRSDAVDINEFLNFIDGETYWNPAYVRSSAQVLTRAI